MEEVSSKDKGTSGGLLVEAIIVLGLIATLTPILYKHVSERRQDIENINEANTLLLLKNATAEYIKANKDMLTTGTVVLTPADIGVNISGYRIGIRKDSEGNIDAMIASAAGGNDLKAGKIASLLGVSAGIYSAQDTARAWGINGLWAENISNYGFNSLPTGIPVITTAYDKEENADVSEALNIDEIIAGLEGKTIKPGEICLKDASYPDGEYCVKKWEDIAELDKFKDAMKEGETCQNNADCGTSGNLICAKPSGQTTGSCLNPITIIEKCDNGVNAMCINGYNANINRNCDEIRKAYTSVSIVPPLDTPSPHRISNNASGGYTDVTCWFPSGYTGGTDMGYTGTKGTTAGNVGLLDACNASDTFACRAALRNNFDIYWCKGWKTYGYGNGDYKLFFAQNYTGSTKYTCDMNQNPAYSRIFQTTTATTYTLPYSANYAIIAYGRGAYEARRAFSCTLNSSGSGCHHIGGAALGIQNFNRGQIFNIALAPPGGIGIYLGSAILRNLALVGGGSAQNWSAGGGWYGGQPNMRSSTQPYNGVPFGYSFFTGTNDIAAVNPNSPKKPPDGSGGGGGFAYGWEWYLEWYGMGGCPSIYSPYPQPISNCTYNPPVIYGALGGPKASFYIIGEPTSGWTKPAKP